MGKRTSYDPGTFCWADLGTTAAGDAKRFYTGLFEWEAEDMPDADGAATAYTMFRLGGDRVAGLAETAQGGRAAWDSFVSVEDVDAVAGRVEALGGELKQAPTDADEHGRIAIAHDPTGARFVLWQPGADDGAERVNEPGCLCWNDLSTPDPEAAARFYEALFGWSFQPIDTGPGGPEMMGITNSKGWRNGSTSKLEGEMAAIPPNWMPYFAVEACPEAVHRATELHGEVILDTLEIPTGRTAVLRDPQGASFGVVDGEMDP
jgi:predicted enzyme related to lactoylglutathione lyase